MIKFILILLFIFSFIGCNSVEIDTTQKFDNPNAKDVTTEQLIIFLENFRVIETQKSHPSNACVYCAYLLHNEAEEKKIKCAIVVIPEINHVITLFHTTDCGDVYVDATRFNLTIAKKQGSEFVAIRNNQTQRLGDERHFHIFW